MGFLGGLLKISFSTQAKHDKVQVLKELEEALEAYYAKKKKKKKRWDV